MAEAPPPRRPAGPPAGGAGREPGAPPAGPPPPPPDGQRPPGRPEYKVYRSRSGPLSNLRVGERVAGLKRLGRPAGPGRRPPRRPVTPRPERRRITVGRVIAWVLGVVFLWLLLSFVVFLVSAQTSKGVSGDTRDALATGGTLLTGSTVLVIGSDQRSAPGEEGQVGRADSIMLLHVGFGSVRRLSILRDSHAVIPGHGEGKINAAYAFGGTPLLIDTIEGFLGNGLEINHVIEVDFKNFPRFIDALGGVTVDNPTDVKAAGFDAAVSAPADCAPGGGGEDGEPPSEGFRIAKGDCHLDGEQALTYARIRQNQADAGEDDQDRAARQQAVLSGIRGQVTSPLTFVRLPWVAWAAPRTVRTDLRGPGLTLLFLDLLTGGTGKTRVLEASSSLGSDLVVSETEKASAVQELLGD